LRSTSFMAFLVIHAAPAIGVLLIVLVFSS
jgi:hypothetical protein